jgi:hypothetical protein
LNGRDGALAVLILDCVVTSPSKGQCCLHPNQKADVDDAVQAIVATPEIGEAKKGDLIGVFVYKFKCVGQLALLAYE